MFTAHNTVAAAAGGLGQQYVIVAGFSTFVGYSLPSAVGSLTPTDPLDAGAVISSVNTRLSNLLFSFVLDGVFPDDDSQWVQLQISGTFEGGVDSQTFVRALADNYASSITTSWQFDILTGGQLVDGNSYTMIVEGPP